jgi:hypothetical protein
MQSPEPTWFYDLDQIFRDLLDEHGDVPLLTIDRYDRTQGRFSIARS